jgi:hypothetical protein
VLIVMPSSTMPTSKSFTLAGLLHAVPAREIVAAPVEHLDQRLSLSTRHIKSGWPSWTSTIQITTRSSVTIAILPRRPSFNP